MTECSIYTKIVSLIIKQCITFLLQILKFLVNIPILPLKATEYNFGENCKIILMVTIFAEDTVLAGVHVLE